MSMRVATFASTGTLLAAALRVQAKEAEATLQQSSGLVSTDYAGLGDDAGRVVSLEASVTRSKAQATAATTADQRVTQMYEAVDGMIDLLTAFQSEAVSMDETLTDDGRATLVDSASSTLDRLVSLMNTQWSGRYLFSGSAVDTAPVDVSSLTSQTAPSTADTSYYQGDDTVASVRVSDDRVVSYGVTADDSAFEKAIRALAMVAGGATDEDSLAEAAELADAAISGLTNVQAGLSLDAETLEGAVSDHEDYQSFVTNLVDDLTSVDVAQVAADMSSYQTQLEAAFSAIGKVQSLSLADYLN